MEIGLDKKMCSMCFEIKPISEFKFKKTVGYYESYCNNCLRLYNREYKRIWRERRKAQGLSYN